jgi:hypothetical protein
MGDGGRPFALTDALTDALGLRPGLTDALLTATSLTDALLTDALLTACPAHIVSGDAVLTGRKSK